MLSNVLALAVVLVHENRFGNAISIWSVVLTPPVTVLGLKRVRHQVVLHLPDNPLPCCDPCRVVGVELVHGPEHCPHVLPRLPEVVAMSPVGC